MASVRYFAAAAAAARTASETVDAATLGELLAALTLAHGPEFERVLRRCTVLVDGVRGDEDATILGAAATVDVLPPFAGG